MDSNALTSLHENVNSLQKYTASLHFDISEAGDGSEIVDLMDAVAPNNKRTITYPKSRYPPTEKGQELLKKDIQVAGQNQGMELVVLRSTKSKMFTIGCVRSRTYEKHSTERNKDKSIQSNHSSNELQSFHLLDNSAAVEGVNENAPNVIVSSREEKQHVYKAGIRKESMQDSKRRGSRGIIGKSLPKKTNTVKPMTSKEKCTFNFSVWIDSTGGVQLTKCGYGCLEHCFHDKLQSSETKVRTSLTTEEDAKLIAELVDNQAGMKSVQSLYQQRTGRHISAAQCYFLHEKLVKNANGSKSFGEAKLSSASALLKYLEEHENISYIALFHEKLDTTLLTERGKGRPKKNSIPLTAQVHWKNGTVHKIGIDLNETDKKEFEQSISPLRAALKVGDKIFLGVAWVHGDERRLFELFPEVSYADFTADTNKEGRPFFLFTGKDSNGNSFIALRAFCPSERRWFCNWLYSEAIPHLLGTLNVGRMQLHLTDGDDNLYTPFTDAISSTYTMSLHGLCIYHLIVQKLAKLPIVHADKQEVKNALLAFKYWLYSWMRYGGVETEAEYQVSLSNLRSWLFQSPMMTHPYMRPNAPTLEDWLDTTVIPHKQRWLFANRMQLRCFDESTTSPTEGCNACMKKNSSLSVKPSQGLDTAAKTMTQQSNVKLAEKQKNAIHAATSTALWSKTKTAPHVTALAEGLMQHQRMESRNYVAGRVSPQTFYIRRKEGMGEYKPQEETELDGPLKFPHTRYLRVRVIQLCRAPDGRTFLACNCCFFHIFGLPCRHIIFILDEAVPEHCAVHWLKAYIAYFKREGYDTVTETLQQMLRAELPGPFLTDDNWSLLENKFPGGQYPIIVGDSNVSMEFFDEILKQTAPVVASGCWGGCSDSQSTAMITRQLLWTMRRISIFVRAGS